MIPGFANTFPRTRPNIILSALLLAAAIGLAPSPASAGFNFFHESVPQVLPDQWIRYDAATVGLGVVGSRLYGVANSDTNAIWGSIYSTNLDGSDFQIEHIFDNDNDENVGFELRRMLAVDDRLYVYSAHDVSDHRAAIYSFDPSNRQLQRLHAFDSDHLFAEMWLLNVESKLFAYEPLNLGDGGGLFAMNLDGSAAEQIFQVPAHYKSTGRQLYTNGEKFFGVAYRDEFGEQYASIFSVDLDGSNFQEIHQLAHPNAASTLAISGSTLVGALDTVAGLPSGSSTGIYSINTDGSNFQLFHTVEPLPPKQYFTYELFSHQGRIFGLETDANPYPNITVSLFSVDPVSGTVNRIESIKASQTTLQYPGNMMQNEIFTIHGNTLYGRLFSSGAFSYTLPVPEPGSFVLTCLAAIALTGCRRRNQVP